MSTSTIIDVNLTLTSPMYVAYPDNKQKNVSLTVKKPVVSGGTVSQIPYFPANGLRGALRRKAAALVMEHIVGKVPSDLYLGLTCGASSGSPDSTALSIEEVLRARRNPYMGLFGGGARLLQSSYRVSDINPVLALTVENGLVPLSCKDEYESRSEAVGGKRNIGAWDITNKGTTLVRVDDLFLAKRPAEIMNRLDQPQQSVLQHQEKIGITKADREKNEGKVREQVANMMTFETVASGTPMHFRITLAPDVSEAQVGLMLMSLRNLIRENSLGGMGRIGFGCFRVDSIKVALGDSLGGEVLDMPSLGSGEEFDLQQSPALDQLLVAAREGLVGLTIDEMNGYFVDFSLDAKKAKKTKIAEAEAGV